jgi:glycine cleavage system H protein
MSDIPQELKYTKDHEWARREADGTVTVGITDHAQASLGDITFVELPSEGDALAAGDGFGVVESVKAASDLYMPLGGRVVEVNSELETSPEVVNAAPYGDGWMIRLQPDDPAAIDALMSAEEYSTIAD